MYSLGFSVIDHQKAKQNSDGLFSFHHYYMHVLLHLVLSMSQPTQHMETEHQSWNELIP